MGDFKNRINNDIKSITEKIEIVKNSILNAEIVIATLNNVAYAIVAAEKVSADVINFMVSHCRGVVRVAISTSIASRCGLYEMAKLQGSSINNVGESIEKWLVSVEAANGVSTGISAFDRAKTINTLADTSSTYSSFTMPGHIFPIEADDGGVLIRKNVASMAVDIMKLSNMQHVAAICELLNDEGELLSYEEAEAFAKEYNFAYIDISDIVLYRKLFDNLIEEVSRQDISTPYGSFHVKGFRNNATGAEAVVLIKGDITSPEPVLMRIHSQCITGDAFASLRCDCGIQLHSAMQTIENEGRGLIIYLFQEGRGIGLLNKIRAYKLQDDGLDTVEANLHLGFEDDERDYSFSAELMRNLGVKKLRILTNNPRKFGHLSNYGLEVVERVPIESGIGEINRSYMLSKKSKLGHILNI